MSIKKWLLKWLRKWIAKLDSTPDEEFKEESREKSEKEILAEKIIGSKANLSIARKQRIRAIISIVLSTIALGYTFQSYVPTHNLYHNILWFGAYLFFAGYLLFYLNKLINTNSYIRNYEEYLRQVEDELDLLEVGEGDNVRRSEKLFRNHQRELKRYYNINLGHYRWIFPVGIIMVILGSAVIAGTIWVFRDTIKDSIAPILIGAVSGVLVDFVGAVLIHMYTETVKSSIAFHNQLMKSNHALFANMLAFKIKDSDKQDETFTELARLMIQSNVEPVEPKK